MITKLIAALVTAYALRWYYIYLKEEWAHKKAQRKYMQHRNDYRPQ